MTLPRLIWNDPPSEEGKKYLKYSPLVEALKQNPNRWACLRRNPKPSPMKSLHKVLNSERYQRIADPYRLEVVVRRTPSGDWGVWARVVDER